MFQFGKIMPVVWQIEVDHLSCRMDSSVGSATAYYGCLYLEGTQCLFDDTGDSKRGRGLPLKSVESTAVIGNNCLDTHQKYLATCFLKR